VGEVSIIAHEGLSAPAERAADESAHEPSEVTRDRPRLELLRSLVFQSLKAASVMAVFLAAHPVRPRAVLFAISGSGNSQCNAELRAQLPGPVSQGAHGGIGRRRFGGVSRHHPPSARAISAIMMRNAPRAAISAMSRRA
jgi:hypothetical protein